MNTQQIAERLAELCRKQDWETAHQELYAEDAVSLEPYPTPAFEKETRGRAAISQKGKKFDEMVETMHRITVSEPLVAGNAIAFRMEMDATMKGEGRTTMAEICVYMVKDGKIVSEQFFV